MTSTTWHRLTRLLPRRRRLQARTASPEASAHWLWVVKPEHYPAEWGEDGADPRSPAKGWWTCSPATRFGDLALIYRTAPKKDIAFLARAESDAFPREPGDRTIGMATHFCDYTIIQEFDRPLPIATMREVEILESWSALRLNFVGAVHRVPLEVWQHLLRRLEPSVETVKRIVASRAITFSHEKDIELALFEEPTRFNRLGLQLVNRQRQRRFVTGGRADLVFDEEGTDAAVVVELKCQVVTRNAVGQLVSYMASVAEEEPRDATMTRQVAEGGLSS
jgi:hypothetical protein